MIREYGELLHSIMTPRLLKSSRLHGEVWVNQWYIRQLFNFLCRKVNSNSLQVQFGAVFWTPRKSFGMLTRRIMFVQAVINPVSIISVMMSSNQVWDRYTLAYRLCIYRLKTLIWLSCALSTVQPSEGLIGCATYIRLSGRVTYTLTL